MKTNDCATTKHAPPDVERHCEALVAVEPHDRLTHLGAGERLLAQQRERQLADEPLVAEIPLGRVTQVLAGGGSTHRAAAGDGAS